MTRREIAIAIAAGWFGAVVAAMLCVWLATPAKAHDPYHGIFNFAGVNCCTGDDCLQAHDASDFEPIKRGYRLRSTGEIVPMAETGFSPDDKWHVCRRDNGTGGVRCLLIPNGGS
jgi:hypothetical protein